MMSLYCGEELRNLGKKPKEYPANKRYTQAEFIKIAKEFGWTVTESRGKGSHCFAEKEGHRSFPIPCTISIGVDHAIKKALGIK